MIKLKPILPPLLVIGLAIGLVQQSRLVRLRKEAGNLGSQGQKPTAHRSESRDRSVVRPVTKESGAAASAHLTAIISRYEENSFVAQQWRNPATRTPEITAEMKRSMQAEPSEMWPHYAALGHKQVLDLIGRLQGNPKIADVEKQGIPQVCVERLSETNPAEALQLILELPDLPERERSMIQTFNRCVVQNPTEAIRWFEEENDKGNPVTHTPEMLEAVMLAQARVDPARAVDRISSEYAVTNPDSVAMLGSKLATSLRDAGEHQAYLAAMRQQETRSGGSPVLAKVRAQYVANLSREMMGWPYEEAAALIGAEFGPEEIVAASQLISAARLADANRWANWFSEIDAPPDGKHPLSNFMKSWAKSDPVAAGKWVDQLPPGELKNLATAKLRTGE